MFFQNSLGFKLSRTIVVSRVEAKIGSNSLTFFNPIIIKKTPQTSQQEIELAQKRVRVNLMKNFILILQKSFQQRL